MRRWIEGWHVGQLVLAWVALAALWFIAWFGTLATAEQRSAAEVVRESAKDAQIALELDSTVRADSGRLAAITDSALRLGRAGRTEEADSYLAGQGLLAVALRESKRQAARESAFDPTIFLVPLSAVLVALPIGGYLMTWFWFAGRARGRRAQP